MFVEPACSQNVHDTADSESARGEGSLSIPFPAFPPSVSAPYKELEMLSREEKQSLAKVPTSKDQAVTILMRNSTLLVMLEEAREQLLGGELPDGWDTDEHGCWINIGCPHCTYKCQDCAWRAAENVLRSTSCCAYQTFNGIMLSDFWDEEVNLRVEYGRAKAGLSYEECPVSEAEFVRCEQFLAGHIEWASLVLRGEDIDDQQW